MIRLSLNLPLKLRFDLQIVKRRKIPSGKTFLASISTISDIKRGSKISRFFRYIFEYNRIKKLLGKNLAFAVIASSVITNSPRTYIKDEGPKFQSTEIPVVIHTNMSIRYPIQEIKVTQKYSLFHPGIDFDGITGDEIYPIMDGVVEDIQYSRVAYGNAVYITHEGGITTLYAHLSKISVKKGDVVTPATIVGLMGATGRASGDHLHFEVRKNGLPINPLSIIK